MKTHHKNGQTSEFLKTHVFCHQQFHKERVERSNHFEAQQKTLAAMPYASCLVGKAKGIHLWIDTCTYIVYISTHVIQINRQASLII